MPTFCPVNWTVGCIKTEQLPPNHMTGTEEMSDTPFPAPAKVMEWEPIRKCNGKEKTDFKIIMNKLKDLKINTRNI